MLGVLFLLGFETSNLDVYKSFPIGDVQGGFMAGDYLHVFYADRLESFEISADGEIIKIGDMASPFMPPIPRRQIMASANRVYIRCDSGYLEILDISNPAKPGFLGRYSPKEMGMPNDDVIYGSSAILGDYLYSLCTYVYPSHSFATLSLAGDNPRYLRTDTLGELPYRVEIIGGYLLVFASGITGSFLYIFSLDQPDKPQLVNTYTLLGKIVSLVYYPEESLLYLRFGNNFYIYDVANLPEINFICMVWAPMGSGHYIHGEVYEGYIYEYCSQGMIAKYSLTNPLNPQLVDSVVFNYGTDAKPLFYKDFCLVPGACYEKEPWLEPKHYVISIALSTMEPVDQYHEDFIQPYQLVCLDNATLYMITVKPLGIKVLDISYPPEAILIKEIQLLEVPKYSDAKLFLDDWVVILAPTIPAPSKLFLINASSPRNPSVAQQIDLPRSDSFGDMGKLFIDDEDSLVIIRTGWNYLLGYRLKGDKLQRVWEYPIGYNFYYHGCLAAKRTFYAFYSDDSLRVHMYVLSTDTPQDAGSKALANREYDVPSSHHVVRDNRLFMTYQACHDVHNLTWCDWAFIILDISDPLDPFVILDQRGGSYWYQCCPDIAVSDSLFYLFGCPHSVTVSRNFAKPNSLDVVGYIDDLKFGNYSITPETQPAFFLSHPDYGLYSVHRTWIPLPSPPSDTVGFISAPTVSRDRFNLVVNMPYDAWARVKAYNMAGQAVAVIHEGMMSSGPNYLSWEPGPIGAGVYIVTIEVNSRIVARARVVYLK